MIQKQSLWKIECNSGSRARFMHHQADFLVDFMNAGGVATSLNKRNIYQAVDSNVE